MAKKSKHFDRMSRRKGHIRFKIESSAECGAQRDGATSLFFLAIDHATIRISIFSR
jgi:hypothetical protein